MAGAKIEIHTDAGDARQPIAQAAAAIGPSGLPLMLGDMGEYLLSSTRERAARQVSPDGTPWQALSPRYRRAKEKARPGLPMLKYDWHMLGDRFSWQVDEAAGALYVGTAAPYGAAQQFGHVYQRAARSQELYFKMKGNAVAPRFVKRKKANFAQTVNIAAHQVTLPARPWLGLSDADEGELLRIAEKHLALRPR